jgi:uncharacterized membrane protein
MLRHDLPVRGDQGLAQRVGRLDDPLLTGEDMDMDNGGQVMTAGRLIAQIIGIVLLALSVLVYFLTPVPSPERSSSTSGIVVIGAIVAAGWIATWFGSRTLRSGGSSGTPPSRWCSWPSSPST